MFSILRSVLDAAIAGIVSDALVPLGLRAVKRLWMRLARWRARRVAHRIDLNRPRIPCTTKKTSKGKRHER